jgi:hypothetical protein
MNGKEPLSRYAQIRNGIQVERQPTNWIDAIVADKRAPVADQVAAKLDVSAWFATLTSRMNEIATDLALGCSTSEAARKHGVTAGKSASGGESCNADGRNFRRRWHRHIYCNERRKTVMS